MKCVKKQEPQECFRVEEVLNEKELADWVQTVGFKPDLQFFNSKAGLLIHSLSGSVYAKPGDMILAEKDGLTVLTKEVFTKQYDLVLSAGDITGIIKDHKKSSEPNKPLQNETKPGEAEAPKVNKPSEPIKEEPVQEPVKEVLKEAKPVVKASVASQPKKDNQ